MKTNHTPEKELKTMVLPITLETAFRMMFTYQFRFQYPFRNEDGIVLKGFSFSRDEIESILFLKDDDGNFIKDENGNYKVTEAERLHVAMGHHFGEYDPNSHRTVAINRPTVIAFGLGDDDKALVDNHTVFDYCDPCPDRCPDFAHVDHVRAEVLRQYFPEH